jgi:hypothetical protein
MDNLSLPGVPPVPKKRGRPTTRPQDPDALKAAAAARQRAYLERKKAEGKEPLTLTLSVDLADALRSYVERRIADGEPLTLGDAAEKILRDRLMRKR